MNILGVIFEYLGYDWCQALGWWLTIPGMMGDHAWDGGIGLHFVNKVVILLGKSMSVAHLFEVDFGEGGSCCFVIGSKGVKRCPMVSNRV